MFRVEGRVGLHGFGAEVIAGAVVLDTERDQGLAKVVAGRIVAGGEAVEAGEQIGKLMVDS